MLSSNLPGVRYVLFSFVSRDRPISLRSRSKLDRRLPALRRPSQTLERVERMLNSRHSQSTPHFIKHCPQGCGSCQNSGRHFAGLDLSSRAKRAGPSSTPDHGSHPGASKPSSPCEGDRCVIPRDFWYFVESYSSLSSGLGTAEWPGQWPLDQVGRLHKCAESLAGRAGH
jgi:hypothetical protein